MEPLRPPPLDFALLQQTLPRTSQRSRRPLWWLLGLLGLVVASVVALVLYLGAFEREEEERRRVTDGQWLEQSVRFHFLRLEEDLRVLARQALQRRTADVGDVATVQGGLLWSQPGAVIWHGWQPRDTKSTASNANTHASADEPRPSGALGTRDLPSRLQLARADHPANEEALSTMLRIAVGLRRSSYAGPLRDAQGALTDTIWLAVPYFERGEFLGNYLAVLSMNACVEGLVPDWFHQTHRVRLSDDPAMSTQGSGLAGADPPYLAAMNLPGTDLFIEVAPLHAQPALVPRIFLLVALLFLAGMLVSLWALRRDIVKRQRVQALLEAQMVLRTAMEDSVTIGMRAWAHTGEILYVNEAFCRMVGYSAAELVGRKAPMPYWPSHRQEEIHVMHRDVIAQGTGSEGLEVQFEHRDGHLVDVLIHEAPLTSPRGEPVGWMSSVMDISETKRAQRQALQQHERLEASGRLVAVGEAASTLAHELNQPLGALSSFAHGLLNRLEGDSISHAEIHRVVQRMALLTAKAGGIIQRVNAFARRRELLLAPVELSRFVQRCVSAQPRTTAARVASTDLVDGIWVQADELLLEHVLNNLLANAAHWAGQGSGLAQVRVATQLDTATQRAHLAVGDSGPGVPPDAQAQIFDAFYSTHDGGMGMGLAICRSIVEAHHGRIEVHTDTVLGGACFVVSLPLATHAPDAQAATPHAPLASLASFAQASVPLPVPVPSATQADAPRHPTSQPTPHPPPAPRSKP